MPLEPIGTRDPELEPTRRYALANAGKQNSVPALDGTGYPLEPAAGRMHLEGASTTDLRTACRCYRRG